MSKEIKRINIKEFREKGYLQELNRRFLHPLGLALEVIIDDETGDESLGGVWDCRKDDDGCGFALSNKKYTGQNRLNSFTTKADYIDQEIRSRRKKRVDILGFWIEPIPKMGKEGESGN